MTEDYIVGNLDVASIALWLFFFFFVALVIWIQRENQREGYPLLDEDGTQADAGGVFPNPADKTFILPHGRGEVTVPSGQNPERDDIDGKLTRSHESGGFPWDPAGDGLADGVGPASWAARKDVPELDGKGHPKIVPMSATENFHVAAGRDPRGLPVVAADGAIVGKITDMWLDEPEQMVRYLEIELDGDYGEGSRLVPLTLARIWGNQVKVKSLNGENFAGVPKTAAPRQVTKLEEDKICAYYGGGPLFATGDRLTPVI
ncbi:photosynthetic reaction center subunit H [Aestuariicoccus sp. MJ-SS9]|uniref:photosynthetic reaction center subunit H n=1 Tax=Aestuariicoccus sp. MJ-SS9 TaxID=3079855 RepID=UPI0029076EAF|nr:photosynthetic reaction center subunit H [Aestuariicoccus sp. MJ-SS9]MDU8910960.1 photosynthetic reaction center subunit H [Aestuariicoccus sp. MJ-SS9]